MKYKYQARRDQCLLAWRCR